MYNYSLPISTDTSDLPQFTTSCTLAKKESKWMTTSEILLELSVRDIKITRPTLLRKGKKGDITMRTDPVNKKLTLFDLTEILEKLA